MTTLALAPSRPATINPWVVAAAVVIPTFMEVLDTTIANVALRYIAGGLSAAVIDSEWVITSYLAANATILPISGWLSARLGRRNYFLMSIAVFTIASGLCGLATSLNQLILFRVIQGLAGGGLQPSSQGVLIDAFPREKQGAAQTVFGFAALLAPVVGPTLGGYLTDYYNWRYIFYINLPVGTLALIASYFLLDDPPYLKAERAELLKKPLNFDYIGFGLLALVMSSWEIMLSKGQQWDWLGDVFWRVQTLLVLFVVGLGLLDLPRNADSQPGRQLSAACRAEFRGVLHHHFLRFRGALRLEHVASRPVADVVRIRRLPLGARLVAVGCRIDHRADGRRQIARPRNRRALVYRGRAFGARRRGLLDVALESADQPVAGCLAARRFDHWVVDDFCPA